MKHKEWREGYIYLNDYEAGIILRVYRSIDQLRLRCGEVSKELIQKVKVEYI